LLFSFAYLLNSRLHAFASLDQTKNRFFQMEQFYEDAKNGQLPCYSWIEPRYFDSTLIRSCFTSDLEELTSTRLEL